MRYSWLALVVTTAGCAAPPPPSGPVTLTVKMPGIGMAVSGPEGIYCGTCDTVGQPVPCPDGPTTRDACSVAFEVGTEVRLDLLGEAVYFEVDCAKVSDHILLSPCVFRLDGPTTVEMVGVEARKQ